MSKLRGLFSSKLAAGAVGLVFVGVVVAVVLSLSSGGGSKSPSLSAVAPEPTATALPPTPTAVPPPPNRADCGAINGTPYLSDAEQAWFEANCASFDAPPVPGAGTTTQVSTGDRLIIPKANVDADVSRVTVPTDGQMPDPAGYFNALWYDFSNLPGDGGYVNAGNLILSGHVDCGKCYNGGSGTAVFWYIRDLVPGDTAEYRTSDGKVVDYVVTSSMPISPDADWDTIVASTAADMTLITCTGTFSNGEYNLRDVVTLKKAPV